MRCDKPFYNTENDSSNLSVSARMILNFFVVNLKSFKTKRKKILLQIVRITGYRSFRHNQKRKTTLKRLHKPSLWLWGRFLQPFNFFYRTGLRWHLGNNFLMKLLLDRVDRDSGGELGHRARAGRDTETKWLSRLKPGVLIHSVYSLVMTRICKK